MILGNLVLDVAGMESGFTGIPQPGYYRVTFGKPFTQTPHVVATVRDVVYPGGSAAPQPWTVYLKDVQLTTFDIVVQRGGQPLPTTLVPAGPDQTKPIHVYWLAIGIT